MEKTFIKVFWVLLITSYANAAEIREKIIPDAEIGDKIDDQRHFTVDGLKQFLENESSQIGQDFKSVECFKAQNIAEQFKGAFTEQLFLIESKCSTSPASYIFKGERNEKEYNNLKNLAQKALSNPQLQSLVWPNKEQGYPSLFLPIAFYQYHVFPQQSHLAKYVTLMHKAPGKQFYDMYLNAKSEEQKKDLRNALHNIGSALSRFHQRFMQKEPKNKVLRPSIVHGDFTPKNIFYDASTKQISFIDNESMMRRIDNPKNPLADIIIFLLSPPSWYEKKDKAYQLSIDWLTTTIVPFVSGYIKAFPQADQQQALTELIDGFKEQEKMTAQEVYPTYEKNITAELRKVTIAPLAQLFDALSDMQADLETLSHALEPGNSPIA